MTWGSPGEGGVGVDHSQHPAPSGPPTCYQLTCSSSRWKCRRFPENKKLLIIVKVQSPQPYSTNRWKCRRFNENKIIKLEYNFSPPPPKKKDKDRREGKGRRRYCSGEHNYSIPCRTSYFAFGIHPMLHIVLVRFILFFFSCSSSDDLCLLFFL